MAADGAPAATVIVHGLRGLPHKHTMLSCKVTATHGVTTEPSIRLRSVAQAAALTHLSGFVAAVRTALLACAAICQRTCFAREKGSSRPNLLSPLISPAPEAAQPLGPCLR